MKTIPTIVACLVASLLGGCAHVSSPPPAANAPRARLTWPDPSARVIHAQRGNRTIRVNRKVVLSRTQGPTVVGKLVGVNDGIVELKTGRTRVWIAEREVKDIANY